MRPCLTYMLTTHLHQRAKLREGALQLALSRGVGYHPDEELVPGWSKAWNERCWHK